MPTESKAQSVRKMLADIVYPSGIKCIVCDEELSHDTMYGLCDSCKLPYIDTFCTVCGCSVPEQNIVCDRCRENVMPFTQARSSCIYIDNAARLVRRFKYGEARYLAPFLAEFMADTYFSTDWEADIVTFVPMHKSRRRMRGYNQSELLAKALSEKIGVPCASLLRKTVKTKNMARLTRTERIALIGGTFAADTDISLRGKTVLLIDDVLTTGATSGECAKVLRKAGAADVVVLTFASVSSGPKLTDKAKKPPNKQSELKNVGTDRKSKLQMRKEEKA